MGRRRKRCRHCHNHGNDDDELEQLSQLVNAIQDQLNLLPDGFPDLTELVERIDRLENSSVKFNEEYGLSTDSLGDLNVTIEPYLFSDP